MDLRWTGPNTKIFYDLNENCHILTPKYIPILEELKDSFKGLNLTRWGCKKMFNQSIQHLGSLYLCFK